MPANNENVMENINSLSTTLTPAQLNQFLTIIDSLNDLLVMANQDTEHAYQLYINSVKEFKNDPDITNELISEAVYSDSVSNVVHFKH